jgi:hypothetical protein
MTTLQAVNQMLEAIGEPPVTSIPTSDDGTEEYRADQMLAEVSKSIQGNQWWAHLSNYDVELTVPDVEIGVTSISGEFTYGETVEEAGDPKPTGTFDSIHDAKMYLRGVSGTFVGGKTLTGVSSGKTATGGTYTAVTSAPIGVDYLNWLRIRAHRDERNKLSEYALFSIVGATGATDATGRYRVLFDLENNDYTWETSINIDRVVLRDTQDLPEKLQQYVVTSAAKRFQRSEKRGRIDEALIISDLIPYWNLAKQESAQSLGSLRGNMIQTHSHLTLLGRRAARTA